MFKYIRVINTDTHFFLQWNAQYGKESVSASCIVYKLHILAFSSILVFFFNCEYILFVHIVKQKQTEKFADFPWGHVRSPTQFGPERNSRLAFIG